ncbi:hypothetical protein AMS68_005907 [Peltaster fructicola]|uniref:Heterokaryon incompatibility domain-containing protein n=1 Tax=Peltaster fructicola TaxID=286661 RepID=A0A6H0Y163_9PEZI|nr:hypothetical protein AMS68_005907 [Peltaster fructicola]
MPNSTRTRLDSLSLSYSWSEAGEKCRLSKRVLIDQQMIPITTNLHNALTLIRRHKEISNTLWWIDMLSIDQSDAGEEKAEQLQLMPQIFPEAISISYWLGQGDESTKTAFDFLRQWSDLETEQLTNRDETKERLITELIAEINDPLNRPNLEALHTLLSKRWFTRIWTFVEACHPTTYVADFLCGEVLIDQIELVQAISSLLDTTLPFSTTDVFAEHETTVMSLVMHTAWPYKKRNFATFYFASIHRQVSEPRDLLYALRSMMPNADRYPVFDKSNAQWTDIAVAMQYTRAVLDDDQNLNILSLIAAENDFVSHTAAYPSWSIKLYERKKNDARDQVWLWWPWQVPSWMLTKRQPMYYLPAGNIEGPILQLQGIRIGYVAHYVAASQLHSRLGVNTDYQCPSWQRLIRSCRLFADEQTLHGIYNPTGEQSMVALMRTLCFNRLNITPGPQLASRLEGLLRQYRTIFKTQGKLDPGAEMVSDLLLARVARGLSGHTESSNDRYGELEDWVMNRYAELYMSLAGGSYAFFKTVEGAIGRCSSSARSGDLVVMLAGSSIPYVLRETATAHWQLIGCAYVHGHMKEVGEEDKLEAFDLV